MGEQGEKSEVTLFNRVILSIVLAEREVVELLLIGARILQRVQCSSLQICILNGCERAFED